MKQLLILSGKGGTGKTTVASAFIRLSQAKAYADCDVDAPNLHMVMHHNNPPDTRDYMGLPKAEIDPLTCIQCGACDKSCRFEAISKTGSQKPAVVEASYRVDPFACEGCGVCALVCPVDAVRLQPSVAGALMLYRNSSVFSSAQLNMGSGASGKLVTEVKGQLKKVWNDADLVIIDGSPGIGCPVIASLSGVDMVLIVAEPTISGISDMDRIVKTATAFQVQTAVCINKYDVNLKNTEHIMEYCRSGKIPYAGIIPYDSAAVSATNKGLSIVDIPCPAGRAVTEVYNRIIQILLDITGENC
jgi:MinD superfamily P-loop ATPase